MCTRRTPAPRTLLNYVPYRKLKTPKEITAFVKKMPPTLSCIRWLCYFQPYEGELLARIFAAHKTKKDGTQIYECMRETIGGAFYLQRNIYYDGMAGWRVWFPRENEVVPDDWQAVQIERMPGVYIELINPETIYTVEKFKYCGYCGGFPLAPYLRLYLEEPGVEFFAKIRLKPTKAIIKKAKEDPNFRKWLRKLTPEEAAAANINGPSAILKAYKQKTTNFHAVGADLTRHRSLSRHISNAGASAALKKQDADKINRYLKESNVDIYAYGDYITACAYLGLNLKDTKNAFPREFRRMHDLRIQEMQSKKAREKAEERRELLERFREVAETLKPFEFCAAGFAILIPTNADELIKEGEALKHCVGRMGYDVKEANRKSFIAFCRRATDLAAPFVTIEYSLTEKKLRQCYGKQDSRPEQAVLDFVAGWAETVTQKLKEQEKAEAEEKRKAEAEAFEEYKRSRAAAATA